MTDERLRIEELETRADQLTRLLRILVDMDPITFAEDGVILVRVALEAYGGGQVEPLPEKRCIYCHAFMDPASPKDVCPRCDALSDSMAPT